jgi:mannose-6-phosphate isomerase-like protein (cupin superfamily)
MKKKETVKQRSDRILRQLKKKYPDFKSYDIDGRGKHFVCEVEPVDDHPEYDRAVEVIISSKPHKHLKMTQNYKIISGNLDLFINGEILKLKAGDKYTVTPGKIHWAKSDDECWLEIYSEPGWTKEDHIYTDYK